MRREVFEGSVGEAGLAIPRTHDCEALLALLPEQFSTLRRFKRGLVFITEFAVATRYPGENATLRRAAAALRWAVKVRSACRDLLHLE